MYGDMDTGARREIADLRRTVEAQAKLLAQLQRDVAALKGKNK